MMCFSTVSHRGALVECRPREAGRPARGATRSKRGPHKTLGCSTLQQKMMYFSARDDVLQHRESSGRTRRVSPEGGWPPRSWGDTLEAWGPHDAVVGEPSAEEDVLLMQRVRGS